MSHSTFDVSAVRGKFPALAQDQVFFDNAGGSQALGTVIDSVREYLSTTNVQLGGTYKVGKQSTARYEAGYEAGAKYINASRDQIVFGSSTTQLFRNLSQALTIEPDDELVVSALDHEANIASWVDLAARNNLTLKWWKPAPSRNPKLTAENLKPLLSDKTRLVACTHASNILGTIHDIKAIAAAAHAASPRALVCVDGVAYAPHRAVDVADLGVDLYAFSWYKVYGPHVAVLYGGPRAQAGLRSLGHFFNASDSLEGKLGLAGASYELVAAVPAVLDYLGAPADGRWAALAAHEETLQGALLAYLAGRDDVTIYGEPTADRTLRVPTVSFRVEGWKPQALVDTVQKETEFGFKSGHFYSYRLLEQTLELDPKEGVVRVSMVHYNTAEEVKSFIAALDSALAKGP